MFYQMSDKIIRKMRQDTLEPTRDVAREICPILTRRNYDTLDPINDAKLLFDVIAIASRVEFVELEIDTCFHPNLADLLFEPKLLLNCPYKLQFCDPAAHEKHAKPSTPRYPHLVGKGILYGGSK